MLHEIQFIDKSSPCPGETQRITWSSLPLAGFQVPYSSTLDGQSTHTSATATSTHSLNTTILNLLATCIAPSTRAVYKRAYNNFLSFHTKYYPHSEIFPISHLHLAQFIAFNIQNGLKGSSIQTQVAGLSYLKKMMGFPSLADHFLVKKLLWSASKATYAHDKRCPITIPMLRRLLAALQINKASMFEQLAYRAMFLTSFFALLRVGEMAWTLQGSSNLLQFQDVKLICINNIATQITLNMKHHKHSKGAPSQSRCTVAQTLKYVLLLL